MNKLSRREIIKSVAILGAVSAIKPALAQAELLVYPNRYINRLPCLITEPGIYRLRSDLYFDSERGYAIDIAAQDVTLDLAGYSIVNKSPHNSAVAIHSIYDNNTVVRNGRIAKFFAGVVVESRCLYYNKEGILSERQAGSVIEDLFLEDISGVAISCFSESARVERNTIANIGRDTTESGSIAIFVSGYGSVIVNNTILRNCAVLDNKLALGILVSGSRNLIDQNNISNSHYGIVNMPYGEDPFLNSVGDNNLVLNAIKDVYTTF